MQVVQFYEFKQKSNIFSLKIDKPILKIYEIVKYLFD